MSKVIIDESAVDEVLGRGVEKIYPNAAVLKEALMSGRVLKLYGGFDPSAASLQIGNAVLINKLAQFQKLGHEVIFLIGDFTGIIGDPTDKRAVRKKLSRDEVRQNAALYQAQASKFLSFSGDNPAKVMYNSQWNDHLSFPGLIDLASNFTVQQMIQRDMFQARLAEEKPIYLHEFFYPLIQGHDSFFMNVDLEIGGNDQTFNMLCGRDLQKILRHKEKFVMTLKLLADDQGKKLGKSENNTFFLNEEANEIFGRVMSWPDELIVQVFESCTQWPWPEIKEMEQALAQKQVNPRDLKMKLARELTRIIWNEESAQSAQDYFIRAFQKKEIPDEIKEVQLAPGEKNIVDLLLQSALAKSRGEARRLIEQGGIKVNETVVTDAALKLTLTEGLVLRRGKRQFVKVKLI